MTWAAVVIIVAQGLIIGLLFYFIRTFGAYTDALVRVHEENMLIRQALGRATNAAERCRMAPPVDYPIEENVA